MKYAAIDDIKTITALIDSLAKLGEREAILALQPDGVERWSYGQLAGRVGRLAAGLRQAGLGRGDAVALLAANQPELIMAALAVIRCGAVVVPLDIQFGEEVLEYVFNDSQARYLFTTTEQMERLAHLNLEQVPTPILLDVPPDDERSWQQWSAEAGDGGPEAEPDEPVVLFYTSGTTGPPKGVPLTHRNIIFQMRTVVEIKIVLSSDRVLLPLPLHHVYPFVVGMLCPLAIHLPLILPQALTGPQIVRAVREGNVTLIIGVPRLYDALYTGIEERIGSRGGAVALLLRAALGFSRLLCRWGDIRVGKTLLRPLHRQLGPSIRLLISGGSRLAPGLAWNLCGLGWLVATGYGLTETSPLLSFNLPGKARFGSAGRPIPGVEIGLDESVPPEGEGEIMARGPGVFGGYRNLPEQSAEVLGDEGWFRTGDLGYFDDDGFLHVTGRASTLIITASGENVQPDGVEAVYQEHPLIREIGVLQHRGRLAALVVPEINQIRHQTDENINAAVRTAVQAQSARLPSYQRVVDYAVTREALPRTTLGKLQRHKLVERYRQALGDRPKQAAGPIPLEEMAAEDRALLEHSVARQVWDWLAGHYPDYRLTPDTSPQLDLGIDSLEWLNLSLTISERTGVELGEESISRVNTIRDLLYEITEASGARQAPAQTDRLLAQPEEELPPQQRRWLEPLGPGPALLARGMYGLNRLLMRGLLRYRAYGRENLPREGPFVLAPNHASYLDPLAVAAGLDYSHLRNTHWAGAKDIIFDNLVLRIVGRLSQTLPIDSRYAVASSLAFGAAALQRRKNLVWFPEGRRSFSGEVLPFKPGLGLLVEHFQVPVVPVYIHGAHEVLTPGSGRFRLKPVTVMFGPPCTPDELAGQGRGEESHKRVMQALHDRVVELSRNVPRE